MEDKNNKLLHALQNSGAENIFEAYCWLQQHRRELNKEAYGPVLLEVRMLKFRFFKLMTLYLLILMLLASTNSG